MSKNEPLLVALPQELADEMIAKGQATRKVASQRSAITDTVILSVSTAAAVVSLLQTPSTVRDLAKLVRDWAGRDQTPVSLTGTHQGKEQKFAVTDKFSLQEVEQVLGYILRHNLEADVVVSPRHADTQQTPAGWYHAQGDPQGTVRYWDGEWWHGDPERRTPTSDG